MVQASDANLFGEDDSAEAAGRVVDSFKPTKRDPRRMSIRVDGKVVVTLPWEVIDALGIHIGMAWSEELEAQVLEAEGFDKARKSALRSLERRAFSEGELIARLRKKDFAETVARKVVAELVETGYLDDEQYGRAVLRELTRSKPAGLMLLRKKMFEKRIERGMADRLIAEFMEGQKPSAAEAILGEDGPGEADYEVDALAQFVERKLAGMQNVDAATQSRRLFGLLARRGFDAATCREYVQRYVTSEGEAGG